MDSPSSDTTVTPSFPSRSPLLQLPAELRFQIYDYLAPWEPKSYPFGQLIISSIDRRAPPTALMATCRYLHDDVLTHFYNTVTFRTAVQTIPGVWSNYTDPITLLALQRVKKIELRLCWDDRYKKRYGQGDYPIDSYLDHTISFLQQQAKSLQTMAISLTDLTSGVDWQGNRMIMSPLKNLVPQVVLCVGEVIATDGEKETELREQLQQYLKVLNKRKIL